MIYSKLCRNGINRKSLATEDIQQAIRQAEATTLTEEEISFYRQQLAVQEECARKASDMAHRIRLHQEDDSSEGSTEGVRCSTGWQCIPAPAAE